VFRIYDFEFRQTQRASNFRQAIAILGAIVFSFFLGGLLMKMISKVDPFAAYWALLHGALGSKYAISETVVKFIPLTLMGLATTTCFRAQIWNIGGNGQIYAGAVAATAISFHLDFLPSVAVLFVILIASAIAGGLWSGIAGYLRVRFGLHEILTTIMMNFIFQFFTTYLLEEVWREPTWGMPWTEIFPEHTWWPILFSRTKIHIGLIIAILSCVALHYLLFHTPFGYEIRARGLNPKAAEFKGIRVNRIIMGVMLIHGALAGLAGAGQVSGFLHRLTMDINPGYGFTGIIVALMGRLTPIGVVMSALFIGLLINGSYNMETVTGVPTALVDLIQGIMFISIISAQIISKFEIRRIR
jgi:simple sugar transport system permease protein